MNKQALIEFTQKLVRQQSLSGEEGPVTQIVVEEMRRLGFEKVWVDENGSAIGVVEGKQTGRTILFDAHCGLVGSGFPQSALGNSQLEMPHQPSSQSAIGNSQSEMPSVDWLVRAFLNPQ